MSNSEKSDRDRIKQAIEDLVSEWSGSPKSINQGECMEFINELFYQDEISDVDFERMETDDLPATYVEHEEGYKTEPYHMWITDGEFHYDPECPDGVSSWKDLPFFKRTLGF